MPVIPELKTYVLDARKSGMTDDYIRQELARVGWNMDDVALAFSSVDVPLAPPVSPAPTLNVVSQPQPQSQSQFNPQSIITKSEPVKQSFNIPKYSQLEPSLPHSPKKPIKATILSLAVVILFLAAGVSAYVFLPTLLDKPPYSLDTFLSDLTANISKIDTAVYNVAISVKTEPKSPNARSLREVFPEYIPKNNSIFQSDPNEPFITQMIRSEDLYSAYLPADMIAELSVEGNIKKSDGGGIKPLGHTALKGSFATPDFSMNADIEFVSRDGVVYGKINRMPAFLFFNFDKLKGKWVKIGDVASSTTKLKLDDGDTAKIFDAIKQMPKVADETKVLSSVNRPEKETLGNETVYRYDLKLNPENMVKYFDRMAPILRESVPEDRLSEFDIAIKEQRAKITDPAFKKFMDYFEGQSSLSVWISNDTKLPVRISSTAYLVSEGSSTSGSNNSISKQVNINLSASLSNINQPVEVETPTGFITIEEAYKLMMPSSQPIKRL
ncbi:MAG TPA: hypothetical protein VJI33_03895 [Candidatus Paceibacterota bacterium]